MSANVQAVSAISEFRSALCTFIVEARQALAAIEMEARRALEYITEDQAQAWNVEVRRGRERVQECKIEIHNTRTFKRIANYTPSCIDEKKALAKAERRLQVAEIKVEAVRHWGRLAEQAFREFQARLAQFLSMLDGELPKGVATLERMMASLDRYFTAEVPRALREVATRSAEPGSMAVADPPAAAALEQEAKVGDAVALQPDEQSDSHTVPLATNETDGEHTEIPALRET
ncbi:MAG: hypothetical protein WD894_12915 [Pirellulales bacterium]